MTHSPTRSATHSSSRAWLLAFCIGAPIIEALLLQSLGFISALPLAPQLSAPAPFGTFHDLRWVFTYAWSWTSATWQLLALLAFRSLFDALIIYAAWPRDAARPSFTTLWRRSILYVVIAIIVMSPWVTYTFAAGVTSYGAFLLASIPASLLTALVMPQGIITGDWWRRILPWRTMPHVIAAWFGLMAAALAMTFSPPWVTVIVAAAGGALNAWLWRRIVATVVQAPPLRHTIPVAPLAIVVVVGLFTAGAGYWFGRSADTTEGTSSVPYANGSIQQPTIYVNGYGTDYDGSPFHLLGNPRVGWHYSYNGLGANGEPLAYGPDDTHQSLGKSARLLATQIDRLGRLTGQLVSVVAESEGTLVARVYFATHQHPPVNRYIQISPLLRPAHVYYPPAREAGHGLLGGWEARALVHMIRLESPTFDAHIDMPFLRSLVSRAPLLRDHTLCPIPGVKTFMFIPLEAAVTAGKGPLSRIQWVALPGWHSTLLKDRNVRRAVRHLLRDGKLRQRPGWAVAFQIIRGIAAAWQAPALPLQLPPWDAPRQSDPAFGYSRCPR